MSNSTNSTVYWSEDYEYRSFNIEQTQEIKQFFEKYGFVVVDNVLSSEECDASIDEVWGEVADCDGNLKREDPDTWLEESNWSRSLMSRLGIVSNFPVIGPWAFKNRVNPNVYHVFQLLLNEEKLWTSFDRFGFLRPTQNVGGKNIDKPEWRTSKNWLHWDLNPWRPFIGDETTNPEKDDNNEESLHDSHPKNRWNRQRFIFENNELSSPPFRRVQGLVSFTDVGENDGGFLTVPGVLHHTERWAHDHQDLKTEGNLCMVPKDNELYQHTQKIPMKAGSLVVWDSRQVHANFPNHSDKFRIAQYIKMFPYANNRTVPCRDEAYMRYLIKTMLPLEFGETLEREYTEDQKKLAMKLLRLESWDEDREPNVKHYESIYDPKNQSYCNLQ
eukprot:gb/GECH01003694.1/.p1 GENE.gb/GECH01003694.1/~~gb/GECH01003694.1/.p1  ORF type:complete len:387 (+),score=91.42 gb/GECH01003694.1/:1-1161(+)